MLATHPLAGGPKAARGEGGRGGRCHHWILGQLSLDNPRKNRWNYVEFTLYRSP
jgi:hypothetical protein